jgi:hypothetical protein
MRGAGVLTKTEAMDKRVITEMTDAATEVLARSGGDVYDAMMDTTGRLLEVVEREHAGAAYLLWSVFCDRWELADGPAAVESVAASAREFAAAWLAIDRTSDQEVNAFFDRGVSAHDDAG